MHFFLSNLFGWVSKLRLFLLSLQIFLRQGGVLCVDVGLSHGLKGGPQVVEILDDTQVRVLAHPGPDGRATTAAAVNGADAAEGKNNRG